MSTDGQICAVCFECYANKSTGSPDTCNHLFCLECILTWAKTSDLCPVDRTPFTSVDILHNNKKLAEVKVEPKKKKKSLERYDFTRVCEICQNRRNETLVLLCDACDLAYHPKCLDPPLTSIPNGEWYCSTCSSIVSVPKRKRGRPRRTENITETDGPRKFGRLEQVGQLLKEKRVRSTDGVKRNFSENATDNVDACPSSSSSSSGSSSEDESSEDGEPVRRKCSQLESFSDLKKKACLTSDGIVFKSKTAFKRVLNIVNKKDFNTESLPKPSSGKYCELGSTSEKVQPCEMQGCSSSRPKHSLLSLNPKKITIENGSLVFNS